MITLDLIATNVYNSVKAPAKRGFSYVEIWMIGVQIPILLGILEYAILLALKKYYSDFIEANTIVFVSPNQGIEKNISILFYRLTIYTFFLENKIIDNKKSRWDSIEKMMDKWTFISSLSFIIIFNMIYWFNALL